MSQDLKLLLDSRVNVSADTTKLVVVGGQQVNSFEVDAQPSGSSYASTIQFINVVTPAIASTVLSKEMRIRYNVAISGLTTDMEGWTYFEVPQTAITSTGPASCLRQFPLSSIAQNLSVVINGTTMNVNLVQSLSSLARRMPPAWLKNEATVGPCMSDNATALLADNATYPSSCQPLSGYYNSDGTTRGSFLPISYAVVGENTTVTFEVDEPILCSPLVINDSDPYLCNVNTLSVQYTFSNLLGMIVNASATPVGSSVTVAMSNAKLELTYISVDTTISAIPRIYNTSYDNVVYFSKNLGTAVGTGSLLSTITVQSDLIRLQATPALIAIQIRKNMDNRTPADADCCLALGTAYGGSTALANFQITFGNRTGLLNSMSVKSAYLMSKKNGLNMSYNDWLMGSGSYLLINPVLDFGLNLTSSSDTLPSEAGNVNFSFQAVYNNANFINGYFVADAPVMPQTQFSIDMIVVYSGKCSISPDGCVPNTGDLTHAEVSMLLKKAPVDGSMVSTKVVSKEEGGNLNSPKTIVMHNARSSHSTKKGGIITSA